MSKNPSNNSTSAIRSLTKTISSFIKDETFRSSLSRYFASDTASNFLLQPNINNSSKSFYYYQLVQIIEQWNGVDSSNTIYNKKSISLIALKFIKILSTEIQTDILDKNVSGVSVDGFGHGCYDPLPYPTQLHCNHCHHSTLEIQNNNYTTLSTAIFPTITRTWNQLSLFQTMGKISSLIDKPFNFSNGHTAFFTKNLT